MNVDPGILIQTQSLFISEARIKEVQMEAAIQQLLGENQQLREQVDNLERHNSEDNSEAMAPDYDETVPEDPADYPELAEAEQE